MFITEALLKRYRNYDGDCYLMGCEIFSYLQLSILLYIQSMMIFNDFPISILLLQVTVLLISPNS